MNKIKRILITGVILAMLVPMAVFAKDGKFLDYYNEGKMLYEIGLTNYKGKASGLPGEFRVVQPNESNDDGYHDVYSHESIEKQNMAVTTGKTTLTMKFGDRQGGMLLVHPVIEKPKANIFLVGEQQEFQEGQSIVLEPGEYFVNFITWHEEGAWEYLHEGYLKVEGKKETTPQKPKPVASKNTAIPTVGKVLVDNEAVSFEAYTIENSNYIKLRDFAHAVTGTKKQFEVSWDSEKGAINLVSNQSYTANGSELSKGNGKAKAPVINMAKIYQDGGEVDLKAYTIDGNNYFKLRDLADAFGIVVTWDEVTSTIGIDTSL